MIEATYPLSPSQKGMLFETLASRRAGLHVEQAIITLRGDVDAAKFAAAWREVARRHPILRTRFRWEGLDEPLQDVHDEAPIDFHCSDDASELNRYVDEDRQRSFDLAAGPLLRVALFRGSNGTHQSVWTTHHILLDGWSVALVVRNLVACYDGSNEVAAPRPYGDYIEWLRAQDQARAEQYWRFALQGVDGATPLGNTNGGLSRATGFGEKRILFSRRLSDSLRLLMRRNRLPFNTLFQAMWALLLSRYSNQTKVIFGATVAGRPPQLAGIESMAGLFINTVPVVIDVPGAATFPTWLRAIHKAESERAQFDYCSTGQIRAWSGAPLFDSVLVFENYPHDEVVASKSFTVDVATSRSIGANTRFPLNLIVEPGKEPGKEIALTAIFDQSRLGAAAASCIANDFVVLAEKIDASSDITVAALLEAMRPRPIPAVYAPPRRLDDTPPRTPAEAKVAAICAEAIGIERIGVRENFFDLGGHSLMAAQVIRRLRDAFSAEFPLRLIFDHPTVEEITRAIDATTPAAAELIPRLQSRDRFPPSFQQERLWFVDQLEGGSSAYNAQAALRIDGDLAVPMLQNAFDEIVRRHEILRTVFRAEDGRVSQIVLEPYRMAIPVMAAGMSEIEALAASELLEPFDLASPPLLRPLLVHTGDREHVLIVTMHHIVTDGWSNSIFFRELAAIYDAFAAGGQSPPLPLPPIQYGDFAAWQRASIEGPEMERLLSYWKTALDGAPPRLDLPACLPRPPKQEGRGAVCAIELPAELNMALRRGAERTTLFMTLLAALDVLLFRLSGQDDIVVGTPIANRERAETEGLIGFFVNTLALRTSLAGRPTFRELLRRVRATALDAYAHQQMPFERLVEELKPERDLSRNPLFQIFLNVLNVPPVTLALGDLKVRPLPLPELVTRFDLTLYAIDNGDAIRLEMLYDTALFRADDVERMLAQLRLILEQIVADPDVAIDACSLVVDTLGPRASRPQWDGGRDARAPRHGAIHDGFRASVARAPERIAVVDESGSWTYAQLDAMSGRVANDLLARGLGNGAVVAIEATPCASLIGTLIGVLETGAAFVILDTAHPLPRRQRIIDIVRPAAVLTLDLPSDGRSDDPLIAVGSTVGNNDVAYIAFTSGSTGEPLGIIGTHRPVTHFLDWHIRTFGLNENDRFSLLSGLSHDPLLRDVFTPLSLGASLHIPPPGVRQSDDLAPWMRDSAITVAHLTPAIGEIVCSGTPLPSLRWAFFGGDVLRHDLVRRFRDRAPSCRMVNFYGATETPQAMAFHIVDDVTGEIMDNFGPVPIGRGIDGVELLLVNEAGILAGVGEIAEICVRTPYLSRGYLNAGSSERFQDNHTIYRTGDVGRYRADGNVEIAGRKGRQLKIRGVRIEPREIEAVLEQHASIRETVVIAVDDVLTACIVPWPGAAIDPDDCRRFVAARLPDSFTPAEIVIADSIPLTPNGKTDHAAIARLAQRIESEPVALADDVERALASIWEEVLGVANVCATNNFFTLGGHSLKATRVVSRIQRDLGVAIPLRELFRAPVLRDLANVVRVARPETRRLIEPLPRAESYAVSHAQRRLWTLAQLAESAAAYSMPRALLLNGDLDAEAFARAMRDLVARHESLRTTFATIDGELRQTIEDETSIDVPLLDLTAERDPLARAVELAEDDAARPFDLDRGPLLRVSLHRLGARQHALLFNAHHIVVDAWSIDILVRELGIAYAAHAGGTVPLMAPLRIQYRDYAAWQNAMLASDEAETHRRYWRERLAAPLPVLELPLDFTRPPVKSYNGRRIPFSLTVEESDALSALARANDVSLYMLLVAIVKVLLHRYSGCDDVIVGAPVAGRNDADLENQIGFFVNMLPLRDHIDDQQPFTQLLRDVARTATEAYDHQQVPFDSLIADLNVARETSRSPLFDVVVVLQNAERSEFRLGDVRIDPFPSVHRGSKFDLNVTFQEEDHRLNGFVEYNTDLWRDDRAARAVTHFRELVRSILAAPAERIAHLNLLPEAERRLVVEEWNATDASYPQQTIHALFDQRALAQPDDVAVIFRDRQLTYGELRRRANALAHTLRAQYGVAAGDRVGVVLERSEQVIVALLAVLKAGAAYVPIDPSYPPERIRLILDDAECCVVIDDALMNGLEDREVGDELEPAGTPDDAAYVIYTSGSTGKPKGCVITHRNVVRLLVNDRFRFDFTRDDVWIVAHSFAFDFSVWEMYGALLYGGRLVVATRDDVRNPAALRALLHRHRVTILNQTPASFYALIDHERGEAMHDLDSHLRIVIFGGDRLDPAQLRPWTAIYPLERVQLVNMYGITETTVHVTYGPLSDDDITGDVQRSPIGVPLPETRVYVCGSDMTVQPLGVAGELYIGGSGVCRGYLNRSELTAQRFLPSPFREGEMLYRTGDTGRWLSDGTLEYFGRNDNQVQIRGFRVELGEIERVLASHPGVRSAVVRVWQPDGDARDVDKRLVAYVVGTVGPVGAADELRAFAKQQLPDYMVPSFVVPLDAIPLTSNGKIDARALPPPAAATITAEPRGDVEGAVASIWREVLHRDDVSADENFFDLGGHSLLLVQVHRALRERLHSDIPLVDLFRFPTVRAIAQRLRGKGSEEPRPETIDIHRAASNDIAVIGMAGRFPGAPDVETFWRNLCDGVESSAPISDDALRAAGVPQSLIDDPHYVKRKPLLDGIEEFDPAFFGISPREAAVMDPQHRLFLECAWEALENAGYDSERCDGRTGVFGGISFNSYLLNNLLPNREALESLGAYPVLIGNDRDFVTTRVSYKLNLRGPSINVSTACSTSLVAVHLACRALIERQCDMALAGGASVKVPQHEGYLYDEGGILSPDGRCRAFDAEANGTVGGSGAGIVVLKRLDDARRDGDVLLAIIKGSAIGNDGSDKIGYSAPSLTGQATVIAEAHLAAGVEPESIGYVEAHGTGTSLGDPIEIAALTQAFRARTSRNGFCAIGSVKTNVGHLDAAAGVTGLIKTVLTLQRKRIPPSLNYRAANPNIDFASTPFVVNTALTEWTADDGPRRAGVSSFGLGGTNVHLVLEEAPQSDPLPASRETVLLPISARTSTALTASIARLAAHFAGHQENVQDAAYTLAIGRRAFPHRAVVVCGDAKEAAELLRANDPRRVLRGRKRDGERHVAFLFPGGGAQHARMGQRLYESEPLFREELDRCATILRPHLGPLGPRASRPHAFGGNGTLTDIRDHLASEQAMVTTSLGLPALFAVEYALARLWMSWGIVPRTMLGHSLGEYVAACLAGVFSLDDALALVALRGRLFETIEHGEMVGVPLSEEELKPFLDHSLSIAAINHPSSCVVSGPLARIDTLVSELASRDIDARRLHISVAAHSSLVDPILEPFHNFVASLSLHAPEIPFVSNVTGEEITPQQATDPRYWSGHLRHTVRFGDGVATLLRDPDTVLLEVGPGTTLTSLAQRHPARLEQHAAIASMRHPNDDADDATTLLTAAGRLWIEGAPIDWTSFYDGERRRRVTLPGAVFERTRCWIDTKPLPPARAERNADVAKWFYAPSWKRIPLPPPAPSRVERWLLLGGTDSIREEISAWLRARGGNVIAIDESALDPTSRANLRNAGVPPAGWAPSRRPNPGENGGGDAAKPAGEDASVPSRFDQLLTELNEAGALPDRVIDCWAAGHDDANIVAPAARRLDRERLARGLSGVAAGPAAVQPASRRRYGDCGFYALLNFARAWRRIAPERDLRITVVTTHAHDVSGDEPLQPEKSLVFGLVKVLGQECARIRCNAVDVVLTNDQDHRRAVLALQQELMAEESPMFVAWRGGHRWALDYEPLSLDARAPRLRENPVILITGGTGGVGFYLARHLAGSGARLVLAGRNARAADISAIPGDVLLVDADVAVAEEIEAAVAQTIERFGALHGVIHAAGVTRGNSIFRLFDELSDDDCETQFRPKVDGVRALATALAGHELDFVLLMSSNASVLGGLGLAAYASANQFLDAFAAVQNRSGSVPWISANWDGWPTASRRDAASPSTSIDRFAMNEREAFEAFRFVAGSAIGQVVVSSGDLPARLDRWTKLNAEPLGQPAPVAEIEGADGPRNGVERSVAALWREMLGVSRLGIFDNFFELRGDSLLGTRLITRLDRQFGVRVPLRALFEDPTVAGLAERIEQLLGSAQPSETEALI